MLARSFSNGPIQVSYTDDISARDNTIMAVPGPASKNPQTREAGPPFNKPDWKPLAVLAHDIAKVEPNETTGMLLRYRWQQISLEGEPSGNGETHVKLLG